MAKKFKVFFPKTLEYNGRIFESGKVHDLEEEVPGFIERWIKRGCELVSDDSKVAKKDKPKKEVSPKVVKEVKPVIVSESNVGATIDDDEELKALEEELKALDEEELDNDLNLSKEDEDLDKVSE